MSRRKKPEDILKAIFDLSEEESQNINDEPIFDANVGYQFEDDESKSRSCSLLFECQNWIK